MKLEELVRAGRMCHGGDPVLAWMIANVVLKRGLRAEVRLDKAKSTEKIDGVAALCMALSRVVGQVNHEARVTVLG
jgi:phage terminase large subunit-like protein